MQAHNGIHDEGADVEPLAHDLAVDLALRRDIDEDVTADRGRARQASVRGQPLLGAVGRFEVGEPGQVFGLRGDAELGELADPLGHLAAAADAAPTTDRIDVHAQ